ncbi:MAG: Mut7-C ubiquitin/RNAse domain-containing protein [Gammaproteobacteria bacterium]|nr:Mut7-C ubiquitin/RNAse domain-containing protein [Gammaproteobacteria bacterium]MCI0590794.1 Mut7-C ubiquitin/RNAse domain-containing protein [Gammaproteobacteria bacterium]
MPNAEFRFYEELNDFLPPERRKCRLLYRAADRASVKHAIEALGVPHTEVELILANGESVDFAYTVKEGDVISVYPQFESLDITPVLRVRERSLREPRFIADSHLGALAKKLRMLGFDTRYQNNYTDSEMARISAAERRVVLTRDRDLLMQRVITHGCYIRALDSRQQLAQVLSRLDLYGSIAPFTRCMCCNAMLAPVQKDAVLHRLPPKTAQYYERYWICAGCERVYWEGSHYRRMQQLIGDLGNNGTAGNPED